MRKLLTRFVLGLLIVFAVIVLSGIGYRAYRQHELADSLVIGTPNGIDEQRFIEANGIEHWITIRGLDRRNPVLFFVHGGPGEIVSIMPSTTQGWEQDFTVVHWDQRGSGRTYERNAKPPADLTLAQMTGDGVEVVRWLTGYLDQPQVILVGHSWGSLLGLHMVFSEPELFAVYVGTGLFVNWNDQVEAQYAYALARARDEGHSDVLAALDDGPPPSDMTTYMQFRALTRRYLAQADLDYASRQAAHLLIAPRASISGMLNAAAGARASLEALTPTLLSADLSELRGDMPVPFVLIQGDGDRITPTPLAVQYFEGLRAPRKALVEIPGAGHYAFATHSNEFGEALVSRMLALLATAGEP